MKYLIKFWVASVLALMVAGLPLAANADCQTSFTVCPAGLGACVVRPMPASSCTTARATAGMTIETLRPIIDQLIPPPAAVALPSGIYCGRVALYTDTRSITERVPCAGRSVLGPVDTSVYNPPQDAYCSGGDNEICYDAAPGFYSIVTVLAPDCPAGYSLTTTGSAGPYQYFACLKS